MGKRNVIDNVKHFKIMTPNYYLKKLELYKLLITQIRANAIAALTADIIVHSKISKLKDRV